MKDERKFERGGKRSGKVMSHNMFERIARGVESTDSCYLVKGINRTQLFSCETKTINRYVRSIRIEQDRTR